MEFFLNLQIGLLRQVIFDISFKIIFILFDEEYRSQSPSVNDPTKNKIFWKINTFAP